MKFEYHRVARCHETRYKHRGDINLSSEANVVLTLITVKALSASDCAVSPWLRKDLVSSTEDNASHNCASKFDLDADFTELRGDVRRPQALNAVPSRKWAEYEDAAMPEQTSWFTADTCLGCSVKAGLKEHLVATSSVKYDTSLKL